MAIVGFHAWHEQLAPTALLNTMEGVDVIRALLTGEAVSHVVPAVSS